MVNCPVSLLQGETLLSGSIINGGDFMQRQKGIAVALKQHFEQFRVVNVTEPGTAAVLAACF